MTSHKNKCNIMYVITNLKLCQPQFKLQSALTKAEKYVKMFSPITLFTPSGRLCLTKMFDKNLYDDYDLELCEAFAVDIEEDEILTGFATVARDYNLNVTLAVNPDKNRNLKYTEYFKLYNDTKPNIATKIARIKFRSPEYVIHHNNGGKENWFLNSKEKKMLIKLLNSPCENHTGFIIWQALILNFNNETGLDYPETKRNKQLSRFAMPYPDYLPIDLKIPDYSDLSK